MTRYTKSAIGAQITDRGAGSFTAVASTGNMDRDGEVIVAGAFTFPDSVPVHLDHDMRASNVVARARPYYQGGRLMIDATFGSDEHAQAARLKVAEGLIDSVSVVFLPIEKREVKGVPTIFAAELLSVDLVSIPSNRDARILSSRSLRSALSLTTADARSEALLALAEVELADAKSVLRMARSVPRGPGRLRRQTDAEIRSILSAPDPRRSI